MITVNGVDLADLGFAATNRSYPALGGERTQVVLIPGRPGGVRAGGDPEPATIRVQGTVAADDHAAVAARIDALAALLRGEQRIRFADLPDREWVGWLQQGPTAADFIAPQWSQRGAAVRLEWVLPDPRAVAIAETVQIGPGPLTLGSAATPLVIEAAARSSLTVRVRAGGAAGRVLTELAWEGAAGPLTIDGDAQTITRAGANAIDGISVASTFPVADPADGADYIDVPAGVTVRYRRRW